MLAGPGRGGARSKGEGTRRTFEVTQMNGKQRPHEFNSLVSASATALALPPLAVEQVVQRHLWPME
jgi:hypothetical protein